MPSSFETVHVALGERSYDIAVGTDRLNQAGAVVSELTRLTHAVVVTDANVHQPHAQTVADSLAEAGGNVDLLIVEPGEPSKSVVAANELWLQMLDARTDRKSVVVAVGGGVVGDLAGFLAATYGRGLAFFQVPTSLLAQVDSSVGGKVGINLPGAKNMVGAFWQPLGVLIDTAVLNTLPEREYHAGLAEVVKYGTIMDAEFFAYLVAHADAINARDHETLRYVVARCCRLKADVVEADERETSGRRAILNYGHTFAHAIEAVAGYGEVLHGEAVAIGMLSASRLAAALGRLDPTITDQQASLLQKLGLPTQMPNLPTDDLIDAMSTDKKVAHGELKFVLPTKIGHVELVGDVDRDQLVMAIGSLND